MNCIYCNKELTGRQTKYCSDKCRWRHHEKTPKRKEHFFSTLKNNNFTVEELLLIGQVIKKIREDRNEV